MSNRTTFLLIALACTLALPTARGQDVATPEDRGPGIRFGRPAPLAKTDGAIRIASYNVLNLFDQDDDPTLEGQYDDLPMATSRDRCESVAKIIRSIDADVLCLQEVESESALRWFRDEFLADMGYEHVASKDVGYYRGVEQSVLSRHPITAVTTWPDEGLADMEARKRGDGWARDGEAPTKFQRSPLMVDVEIPAGRGEPPYELTVVVVHHKSGRFRRQRESEALQLVQLLADRLEEEPDLNLVIATTARSRDMTKRVLTPRRAAEEIRTAHQSSGARTGVLFGKEAKGLSNEDVALADAILNAPLNPGFSSLNLAQAVFLVSYEWRLGGIDVPDEDMTMPKTTRPANHEELVFLFEHLERELDACGFLKPPERVPVMVRNLRNLFQLYGATRWQTLRFLRLPAALPYFLGGLRIAGGLSLIGAIVAEFTGANLGIGTIIVNAGYRQDAVMLFSAIIVTSLVTIAMYYAVILLEKFALRWPGANVES